LAVGSWRWQGAALTSRFSLLDSQFAARAARRVVALGVALSICGPAYAQRPRPDRLYRGLFGGNGADPNSAQQLDINVAVFGAYDDNLLADQGQSSVDPRFQVGGRYAAASVSLDYSKRAGRATFDFTGGTTYRYYPSISEMTGFNYYGSIGLTAPLSTRTELRATESVSYTPFYSFGPFPGATPSVPGGVAPISPDYPLFEQPALYLYSAASLAHRMTPRSSLSADYTWSSIDYRTQDLPYRNWGAGGGYSYALSSRASVRAGYHYRKGISGYYSAGQPVISHDIDIGIDYSRPLSASRRTTFGFSTGSTIYRAVNPGTTDVTIDQPYKTHYFVNGSVFLNQQIGRSWNARVNYQRGMEFVPGFADPFFADSVAASLGGFLAARSRLEMSAAYSNGSVGIGSHSNYDSYTASASYQFALAKWGAFFADYTFYHYVFDQTVVLPPGMNRGQDRQSIRGGMNLWLPLLR
jgi:hypothetical protein